MKKFYWFNATLHITDQYHAERCIDKVKNKSEQFYQINSLIVRIFLHNISQFWCFITLHYASFKKTIFDSVILDDFNVESLICTSWEL
jgi:hypothetical protein